MSAFDIDEDITRAKTLPSEFYTDGRYFAESREKIFAKSWQFLGLAAELSDLTPVTILPEFLDEPVLLTRSHNNYRCLSNVCTHRGKILVESPSSGNLIRCGYHGRRFGLDGKFLSMPEFEAVCDFPTADDDLRPLPLAKWGEMLFAALEPAAGFDEFVAPVAGVLDIEAFAGARVTATRDYQVKAHWALYCENYLEGFHIPYVHRSLNEIVDYETYTTQTFRYSSLQTGFDSSGAAAAYYLFLFPNLMFNFYPWGISINIVRPVDESNTTVTFLTCVTDESKRETGAGADLHGVEVEDEAVVESVQKGIRSRYYSRGRYSPSREQGTHHFHRLIAEFMGRDQHR